MPAQRRVRWRELVVPLVAWTIVALAVAGCNDSPSSSSAPAVQGLAAQGVAAASATPETFRNLGKRAESVF